MGASQKLSRVNKAVVGLCTSSTVGEVCAVLRRGEPSVNRRGPLRRGLNWCHRFVPSRCHPAMSGIHRRPQRISLGGLSGSDRSWTPVVHLRVPLGIVARSPFSPICCFSELDSWRRLLYPNEDQHRAMIVVVNFTHVQFIARRL
jgi:hypothetical protein